MSLRLPLPAFSGFPRRLVGIPARGGRYSSHQLDKSLHSSGSLVSLQERNSEDTPLQEYRVADGELLYISCPAARAPKVLISGGNTHSLCIIPD